MDIAQSRLHNQQISSSKFKKPHEVVGWLGAIQAQDYLGGLWAVGLRTQGATEKSVEKALADRTIIRTWPMRGTLHFVAAEDARWMLALMTPRVIRAMSLRMHQLELNEKILERTRNLIAKALHGGKQLTRDQLYEVLDAGGVSHANGRSYHLLTRIAHEGITCFGARVGKQQTFALLDEWVPKTKPLQHEEALTKLAIRYFTGHGPATIQDCMWWSGLPATELRKGIELAKNKLAKEVIDGQTYYFSSILTTPPTYPPATYALPPFDEYIVGYKDRKAVLDPAHAIKVNPGLNGMLSSVIVINGKVVGTWKRVMKKNSVSISTHPFGSPFTKKEKQTIDIALKKYSEFLGLPIH